MKKRHIARSCLLLLLGLIFLLPQVITLAGSFMSLGELLETYAPMLESARSHGADLHLWPQDPTLENYAEVIQSTLVRRQYANSIIYSFTVTVFQLVVASLAAYGITRIGGRTNISLTVYAAMMLLPAQVTMVPNYLVAKWMGLLDTPWALILPGIFAPLPVYFLTRAMGKVPKELGEAAALDGAGEWITFRKIYLPECAPTLAAVGLLGFLDTWNMVEQPLGLVQDRTFYPLGVTLAAESAQNLGRIFAAAALYTIPPMGLFILMLVMEKRGQTHTGHRRKAKVRTGHPVPSSPVTTSESTPDGGIVEGNDASIAASEMDGTENVDADVALPECDSIHEDDTPNAPPDEDIAAPDEDRPKVATGGNAEDPTTHPQSQNAPKNNTTHLALWLCILGLSSVALISMLRNKQVKKHKAEKRMKKVEK